MFTFLGEVYKREHQGSFRKLLIQCVFKDGKEEGKMKDTVTHLAKGQ